MAEADFKVAPVFRTGHRKEGPVVGVPDRRYRWRALLFCLFALWILAAPAYRQVLGGELAITPQWVMYRGGGLGLVDVVYYLREPEGRLTELSRYETLGYRTRGEAPPWLWRIVGTTGLEKVTAALCESLGPEVDLRAKARIARRTGWEPLLDGGENLCNRDGTEVR